MWETLLEEMVERLDFRRANWSDWETACSAAVEKWLEARIWYADMNDAYKSLVSVIHETASNIIPTKTICRHSRGWWNQIVKGI